MDPILANWDTPRKKRVLDATSAMGLCVKKQTSQGMRRHYSPHKRRYATESELNDPNHKAEDDFVIKALQPLSMEAKASQSCILARSILDMYPCRNTTDTKTNILQDCITECCQTLDVDQIVTLGLGLIGDGTLRWSINHVLYTTIVDSVLQSLIAQSKPTKDLQVYYQTTTLDGPSTSSQTSTLLGSEPGLRLPAPVYLRVENDFTALSAIDNDTIVVLLSRDNPWRQFLGTRCRARQVRPAMIICVPHDANPADAESGCQGEARSRDELSGSLSQILDADYASQVLREVEMRGSFAEGQPKEVLVDKLNVYIRRS